MTFSRQRPSPQLLKPFLPRLVPREQVDATSDAWRNARILGSWTTSAFFVLDGTHHKLGYDAHEDLFSSSTNFAIRDAFGTTAGCILLPKDFCEDSGTAGRKYEFLLISRSLRRYPENPGKHYMTYFDESAYKTRGWCYLNVMMISRIGGTALRVGVGIMSKDAWGAAAPETTFVKLV